MATSTTPPSPVSPLTKWLVLILASIGFAFDIYELLMLPLVGPDALPAMGIPRGSDAFRGWVATLFYVPAVFGGIFGLMGGYLTDWLGRRAVLTYSILLYAVSAFLAAFSTNPWILLVFRCGVFVGVCVEFVAAVAWLAELFPDPKAREKALGYTQAFSSIGGLLVAIAYGVCKDYGDSFYPISMPDFLVGVLGKIPEDQTHSAWRYTLMSGLIPAIPLLVIRPFLPESPAWKKKKDEGTLARPNIKELFTTPSLRTATIVTTIMFACSYGAAFGTIQQMRNIIPGLKEVQEDVEKKLAKKMSAVDAELADLKKNDKGINSLKMTALFVDARIDEVVSKLNEYEKRASAGKPPETVKLPAVKEETNTLVQETLSKDKKLKEETKLDIIKEATQETITGLEEKREKADKRFEKKWAAVNANLAELKKEGKGIASLKMTGAKNPVDINIDKVVRKLNEYEKAASDGKPPEVVKIPLVKEKTNTLVQETLKKDGELTDELKLEIVRKAARESILRGVAGYVNVEYTKVQEIGGLIGRFLLAFLVVSFASKRALIRVFQIPGLIITPLVFFYFLTMPNTDLFEIIIPFKEWDIPVLKYLGDLPLTPVSLGVALIALCTIAQFSFWGNYLPLVYPVRLRGTGESFAANIGGRLVGTFFAAVTIGISSLVPKDAYPTFPAQMGVAAAGVGLFVYLVGFICSFFLPEPPKEEELEAETPKPTSGSPTGSPISSEGAPQDGV